MSDDNDINDNAGLDPGDEDAMRRDQSVPGAASSTPPGDGGTAFDVAGAALGALDPAEEADLYAAASVDPGVSAELAAMEAVVAELARLAPLQPMNRGRSAGIRSRLIARAAGTNVGRRKPLSSASADLDHTGPRQGRPERTPTAPPARHQAPTPTRERIHRPTPMHAVPFEPRNGLPMGRLLGGLALAAGLVIAAFGLHAWRNRTPNAAQTASVRQEPTLAAQVAELRASVAQKDSLIAALTGMHTRVIDLVSYSSAAPMARMFWDQQKQMFIMYASNVKQPPAGKVYQVWLITRGAAAPVSAGTFMPDSTGSAVMATRHPMDPGRLRRVAVTEEPDGGMPAPTGPVMFVGAAK